MKKQAYTHSFARIYDDIMSGVPYDFWYRYLQELLAYFGREPDSILELACGTGNMSLRFSGKKKDVVGIDISGEMLNIARQKAKRKEKNIKFVQSDIRNFSLERKFALVFSVFDSINYILSLEELDQVFSNVARTVKDNGVFIFDMNTLHRLLSIEPGTAMFTGDDYSCIWEDRVDHEENKWMVKLKIELEGEEEGYFEEFHQETSYPLETVKKLLKKNGFMTVKIFRAYSFSSASEKDNRVYFVACKEKTSFSVLSLLANFCRKIKWSCWKAFCY